MAVGAGVRTVSSVTAPHGPEIVADAATTVAAALGHSWERPNDPYADSPFAPLRACSSRTKGAKFEELAEWHLREHGHEVIRADASDYDRRVDGRRVEIKGSFLWSPGDMFRWQQIRLDQDYDLIVFLALYPDRVEYYACTKEEAALALRTPDASGKLVHNQHGGHDVDSGTFFIDGLPEEIEWFHPLDDFFPDGE